MLPKAIAISLLLVSLTGCAEQIKLGVGQTRSTIPEIMEDQALINVVKAYRNSYNIPAQFTLQSSLTSTVNSLNAGISPDIALRAIAITGLSLNSSNALTQNWSANPVTGFLDIARLQLLYHYATNAKKPLTFKQFEDELYSLPTEQSSKTTTTDYDVHMVGGKEVYKKTKKRQSR